MVDLIGRISIVSFIVFHAAARDKAHCHRMDLTKPKEYHRGLWLCIGLVCLIGGVASFWGLAKYPIGFLSDPVSHVIGALIAMVVSTWASFAFFRGSITGSPPLYSKGWFKRSLHFAAGIMFTSLEIAIALLRRFQSGHELRHRIHRGLSRYDEPFSVDRDPAVLGSQSDA